jgi:hypothetical protein
VIGVRARLQPVIPAPTLLGLAIAGAAATCVALAVSAGLPVGGDLVRLRPPARVLLIAAGLALVTTALLAPHRFRRSEQLAAGLTALGALAVLLALADPLAVAVVLVLVGLGYATRPSARPFAVRARGPALAAALLGAGWAFVQEPGASWQGRIGALALALGIAAAAGLLPYLPAVDLEEPASSSYLAWTGFLGPALALALPARLLPAFTAEQGGIFGGALVGLGLVNLAWGTVGAWLTKTDVQAWRCSFLADWGLALVGMGLLLPDGVAAAYLALLSIVVVRLPLYLWSRPVLLGQAPARMGPLNVVLVLVLAGAAPFSGFPVRLLVLHAATQVAWPLAVPLLLAMLAWTAHAVRLARTLGTPGGRTALGLWLTLAASLVLGLAPGAIRALGGL